jgi:hypothetical protein
MKKSLPLLKRQSHDDIQRQTSRSDTRTGLESSLLVASYGRRGR